MATIGIFTANPDGSFTGDIDALAVTLRDGLSPRADKPSDKSPDFRITCGKANLGAAWTKTSKDKNVYQSVRLDDPSFGQAINAALVEIDGVPTLVWSRSTGPRED